MKRTLVVPVAAVAAALAVAGCGSSNNKSSSSSAASTTTQSAQSSSASGGAPAGAGGGSAVKLAADPSGQLKFDTSSLSAKAGTVTIDMTNPSSTPHGIAVEGNGVDKTGATAGQGGSSKISVKLKPGKYTFYCPVPGHKAAGMEGTLTVK